MQAGETYLVAMTDDAVPYSWIQTLQRLGARPRDAGLYSDRPVPRVLAGVVAPILDHIALIAERIPQMVSGVMRVLEDGSKTTLGVVPKFDLDALKVSLENLAPDEYDPLYDHTWYVGEVGALRWYLKGLAQTTFAMEMSSMETFDIEVRDWQETVPKLRAVKEKLLQNPKRAVDDRIQFELEKVSENIVIGESALRDTQLVREKMIRRSRALGATRFNNERLAMKTLWGPHLTALRKAAKMVFKFWARELLRVVFRCKLRAIVVPVCIQGPDAPRLLRVLGRPFTYFSEQEWLKLDQPVRDLCAIYFDKELERRRDLGKLKPKLERYWGEIQAFCARLPPCDCKSVVVYVRELTDLISHLNDLVRYNFEGNPEDLEELRLRFQHLGGNGWDKENMHPEFRERYRKEVYSCLQRYRQTVTALEGVCMSLAPPGASASIEDNMCLDHIRRNRAHEIRVDAAREPFEVFDWAGWGSHGGGAGGGAGGGGGGGGGAGAGAGGGAGAGAGGGGGAGASFAELDLLGEGSDRHAAPERTGSKTFDGKGGLGGRRRRFRMRASRKRAIWLP